MSSYSYLSLEIRYKEQFCGKKDSLEYVKSHWKRSEINLFSCSLTQKVRRRRPTMVDMVSDIFEDYEPPSKNFLATQVQGEV